MFKTDFIRTALATIGTLVLTTTMVTAAVGPARVAETTPVVYAEAVADVSGEANA
jgi:hypothetical protein